MDESGNLDFSAKGTRYFVLAAITSMVPLELSKKMQSLKYRLLAGAQGGSDFEYFHASEDSQKTRNSVFDVIASMKLDMEINYMYTDKRLVSTHNQGVGFYKLLGSTMVKYLLSKYSNVNQFDKIVIIFDKVLSRKEQDIFMKEIKPKLKEIGVSFAIYFHKTISDFNAQIADYCAWAKYVSLERGEMRPMKELNEFPIQSFNITDVDSGVIHF